MAKDKLDDRTIYANEEPVYGIGGFRLYAAADEVAHSHGNESDRKNRRRGHR